jgi:MSHA biogenesis protein MshJ
MSLQSRWQQAATSFNTRPVAEKWIIAVVAIGAIVWLYYLFVLTGQSAQVATLNRQLTTARAALITMEQREQAARQAAIEDPNQAVRLRIERAIEEQQRLEGLLTELAGNLVTPQEMTRLLTSMLQDTGGIELVSVENLAPMPMRNNAGQIASGTAGSDDASSPDAGALSDNAAVERRQQVFQHSLVLELQGDFLSLIEYLGRVESFAASFFWDELSIEQDVWPNARVRLQLHTLSTEEGFVGV